MSACVGADVSSAQTERGSAKTQLLRSLKFLL